MLIPDGLSPPLGLCLLAQSLWRESNLLDNWQLTMLPLSELCEFNPRWARDNLSSLWVIGGFPQPEKKQHEYFCMYVCVRVCVHAYTHACMSVSMHVCLSACMRLLLYCPKLTVKRTSNTNMLYEKKKHNSQPKVIYNKYRLKRKGKNKSREEIFYQMEVFYLDHL